MNEPITKFLETLKQKAKTYDMIELESCKLYDEVFCQKTKKRRDIDIFCKRKWVSLEDVKGLVFCLSTEAKS